MTEEQQPRKRGRPRGKVTADDHRREYQRLWMRSKRGSTQDRVGAPDGNQNARKYKPTE